MAQSVVEAMDDNDLDRLAGFTCAEDIEEIKQSVALVDGDATAGGPAPTLTGP